MPKLFWSMKPQERWAVPSGVRSHRILVQCDYLVQYDTVYVMVDNRNLAAHDGSGWPPTLACMQHGGIVGCNWLDPVGGN